MRAFQNILLLVGLFLIADASPNTSSFRCSRYCKEEKSSFGYEIGKVYVYSYKGTVRSLINSTKAEESVKDESGINFSCTVKISVISSCDFVMKISDVQMEDYYVQNDQKIIGNVEELSKKMEIKPTHFSFNNGKIDTICSIDGESKDILNLKRGIISVFQNSVQSLAGDSLVYETDICGTCITHYEANKTEHGIFFRKTKNLDACTHRTSQYLSWQSVPYSKNNRIKSLPLLRSSSECKQKYSLDNILSSSVCEEKHIFHPSSNGYSGALTSITQELNILSIGNSKEIETSVQNMKRFTLIYENEVKPKETIDLQNLLFTIEKIDNKTIDFIDNDTPILFSQVKNSFQYLNVDELMFIFNKLNLRQRKIFIDAISITTTTSAIEVMKQLFVLQEVTIKQTNNWITSLSFTKNPTIEIISSISSFLAIKEVREKSILAVSSLLHRYCEIDTLCLDKEPIFRILKEIEKPLEKNFGPMGVEKNRQILLALKGIGNAGITTSLNLLRAHYMNHDNLIEIRLAAIAAHRRMSCTKNFNLDDFNNFFADVRMNTEIRIASYLGMMKCASYASIAQIKDVLLHEESNQIGSFVWTHLTNLQETATQWKQGLKNLLENDFLKNKFNTDIRKYSRNYEASTFFDSVGMGGSVESNIIFSPDSYLPRSAMFNFTVDLFGETINVFEFGTRLEGFEDIVENFFGPQGYFSDKNLQTFFENAKRTHEETNQDINRLGRQFSNEKVLKRNAAGILYAKMFGNEFTYTHFNSLKDLIGEPVTPKDVVTLLLDLFRENDIDFTKSFVFLESTYNVPTLIGLPLQLKANGTSTVGLTVKGKLNLTDLLLYKVAIEGKIYPSISIHIDGSMILSGFGIKSGIKYSGSMNSNSYLNGHVFINSGKVVDLKLNIPHNQMDVINLDSNVFIIHNNDIFKIQDISDNIESIKYCTPQSFNKLTGCEICSVLKYTNASQLEYAPHFPLTGEFKYALYTKKIDKFDNYQLQLNTQIHNNSMYAMSLYVDTPNSTVNRKIVATYHLDPEKLSIQGKLISPIASFEINSSLGKDFNKYHFQFLTTYNNKEIISMQSTFKINHVGNSFKYEPSAKFSYRHKQIASVSGMVNYIEGTQYTADLKLEGVTQEPIVFVSDLIFDLENIEIKANMNSPRLNGKLQAVLTRNREGISISASSTYGYDRLREESISLILKINKIRGNLLHKDNFLFTFQGTQYPIYNTNINLSNQRGKWYFNNNGSITIFGTTWKTVQLFKFSNHKQQPDVALSAYLTCKEKNIDYSLALAYSWSLHMLRTQVLMQINTVQRIEFLLKYITTTPKEDLYLLLYYPKQRWSFEGFIDKKLVGKYLFNFDGQLNSEGIDHKLVSIRGDYANTSVGGVQNHNVNCSLNLPTGNGIWSTPWTISFTLQNSKHIFISFTRLETQNVLYISHLNWMKNTFSFGVQANDKRLIVINTAQTTEAINVLLGLNIYQHFELVVNLLLPYEKLDLEFFWDKDNNEDKKLLFAIEKNAYKGLYNANIQYPNQKISAAFILLPTQVTLNVTWGIVVSQKIYLKMGNKIYSVGGIWFGELETPFDYLEKQEFFLKYYVVSHNFEVNSNVSWRQHNMNLLVSGSKSKEHLKGYFRLNTTLPEIYEIETDVVHRYNISENSYISNADFTYNQHTINAESLWKLNGLKINSNFKIESPTNTIRPLSGVLNVDNDEIMTHIIFNISWQEKVISALYNLQSDTALIEITTPFEGIEKTILQYSVKANPDSVYLSVIVDLLNQLNEIAINFKHFNSYVLFWMDLTSPVTGYYYLNFTHSTVSGHLKESFNVKGPENKDIVLFNLEGHVDINIVNTKVTAFLKLLEHNASLNIVNNPEPLSSVVSLNLNDFTFESKLFLKIHERYQQLRWNVTSNRFQHFKLNYIHADNTYVLSAVVFENYLLANYLSIYKGYDKVENYLIIKSPEASAVFDYFHLFSEQDFKQNVYAKSDKKELKYMLRYNKLLGNFDVNCNFDNIKLTGYGKIDYFNSSVNAYIIYKTLFNIDVLLNHGIFKSDQQSNFIIDFIIKINTSKWVLIKWENGYGLTKYLKLKTEYLDKDFSVDGNISNETVIVKINDHNQLLGYANISYNKGFIKYNQLDTKRSAGFDYTVRNDNGNISLKVTTMSNIQSFPNITLNLNYYNRLFNQNLILNGTFNNKLLYIENKYLVSNINQTLLITMTGQFLHKYLESNSSIVDANINVSVKHDKGNRYGKLDINFFNDKLRKTGLCLDYMNYDNETRTLAVLENSENIYKLAVSSLISNGVFNIQSNIDRSNNNLIAINLNGMRGKSNSKEQFSNNIFLTFMGKNYSAEIKTSLEDLNRECLLKIDTPTDKYLGHLNTKFNENAKFIDFSLNVPRNSVNEFTMLVTKGNLSLSSKIDFLKLPSKKLLAYYNVANTTILDVQYYNDSKLQSVLHADIDDRKMNVKIDWNFEKVITITGTHKLNSLKDFAFSYIIKEQKTFIKLDILNFFGNIYQTKFDVSTNIKKWNRLALESKLDNDKIRISLNIRNNHMGLIAKRYTGKWDEVLFIQLQGETLLEIWTGEGQTTIRTSSRFGIYRLFVQYTEDPGIYAFSILKDGENVISLMLQDFSTHGYFDLKGKLIAPALIPTYTNLSLLLHVDYDLPKSLQFQIHNSLTQLFELKWYTRLGHPIYTGYFKFNTIIPFVPEFEINPTLNITEDFSLSAQLVYKNYGAIKNEFYLMLLLPRTNTETKFSLIYPCLGESICDFVLNLKPKYVNVHWISPFTGWKNISLNMHLVDPHLNDGIATGALRIRNDTNYFNSVWSYGFEQFMVIRLNVEENIYNSLIDFNIKRENDSMKNNFVLNHFKCTSEINLVEKTFSLRANKSDSMFESNCTVTRDKIEFISIKNNKRLFGVFGERRRLSGKLRFFWNFISIYDGRLSYDFGDQQNRFINLFWMAKEDEISIFWYNDQPYLQIYNVSVNSNPNLDSGIFYLNRTKNEVGIIDEFSWLMKNVHGHQVELDWKRNKQSQRLEINHFIGDSSINSSLVVSGTGKKMELLLEGNISGGNTIEGGLVFKSPLPSLNEFTDYFVLTHSQSNYRIYNSLSWTENGRLILNTSADFSDILKLETDITSSFMRDSHFLLMYEKTDKIIFNVESKLGNEFVSLSALAVPGETADLNLNTSFDRFRNIHLKSKFNKNEKNIILDFINGNSKIIMLGEFVEKPDGFQIIVQGTYPGGEVIAQGFLIHDASNLNASFQYINETVKMRVALDNKTYCLSLKTPYEYAKNVELSGMYRNDANAHDFKTIGYWNQYPINITGELLLLKDRVRIHMLSKIGNNYQGEANLTYFNYKNKSIEFLAYFPNRESYAYAKFDNFNETTTLVLKSPFKSLHSLHLQTKMNIPQSISYIAIGNILEKEFSVSHLFNMNTTDLGSQLLLQVPDKNISVNANLNYGSGLFTVYESTEESWNNITFNYQIGKDELRTNVFIFNDRYNSTHNLICMYKRNPDIKFGVILNDFKIIASKLDFKNKTEMKIFATVPKLGVKKSGVFAILDFKKEIYDIELLHNENLINSTVELKRRLLKNEINVRIPKYFIGKIKNVANRNTNGFEIISNVTYNENVLNLCGRVINNNEIFEFKTNIQHDRNDFYYIRIEKNLKKIEFKTPKYLDLKFVNGQASKASLSLFSLHKIEMELHDHFYSLKLESPFLAGEKIQIETENIIEDKMLTYTFKYSELNYLKYNGSLIFKQLDDQYFLSSYAYLNHIEKLIDLRLQLNKNIYNHSSTVYLNVLGVEHSADINLNFVQPHSVKLDFKSPHLQNGRFLIQASNFKSTKFFIGEFLTENYFLYESIFDQKSMVIEIKCPKFIGFKEFTLKINWSLDTSLISRNYLKISDFYLYGDVLLQADFLLLDDFLDIETHLQVPFLKGFETFDAKVYLPKEFRPIVFMKLPNSVIYSLHFNYTINNNLVLIDAAFQSQTKFILNLVLDQNELKTHINVPFAGTNFIYLNVKKGFWKVEIQTVNYSLKSDYLNLENQKSINLNIQTPLIGHEFYLLDLEYKMEGDKVFKALVNYPGLIHKIGMEFNLALENIFKLLYNIYLPRSLNGFDFGEFYIVSKLYFDNTNQTYHLECQGNTNNNKLNVNVDITNIAISKHFLISSVINNKQLFLSNISVTGEDIENLYLNVMFQFPLRHIQNIHISFNTKTDDLFKHSTDILAIMDNKQLIHSYLYVDQNRMSLLSENIWFPFHLEYKYVRGRSKLDIYGKYCWNLRKQNESEIGGHLFIKRTDVSASIFYPSFYMDGVTNSNKSNTLWHSKLIRNNNTFILHYFSQNVTRGNEFQFAIDAYLQLPFRTFRITQNSSTLFDSPTMNSSTKLIWGDENTSKVLFQNEILPGKLISRLSTHALAYDIVFKVDMSQLNSIPSILKTQLEYSPDPDRLVEFQMFYDRINGEIFATERRFTLKHVASKIDYELYFNTLRRADFSNGSVVLKYKNYGESNSSEAITASVGVDHYKFGLLGEVNTKKNHFHFRAASTSGTDSHGFLVNAKVNEKDPVHLECTYHYKHISPSFNFVASYGDSRRYIFYAGLPNNREFTAKLGHEMYGQYSLDTLLTVRLNTTQLLWIKVVWKKELYPEFYKAVFEEYNDLRYVIEAIGEQLIDVMNDDFGKAFINDTSEIKLKINDYVNSEKNSLRRDFDRCEMGICFVFQDNAIIKKLFRPYVKFVYELLSTMFEYKMNAIEKSAELEHALIDIKNIKMIKMNAKDILKKGIKDARTSIKEMANITIYLLNDFDLYAIEVKTRIEEFFEPFLNLLDDLIAYFEHRLAIFQITVLHIMDNVQKYIYNLKEIKEIFNVYSSYINWLEDLHVTDVLEPIGDVIEEILEIVITDIKKVTDDYKPYLDALSEMLFGKYNGLNQLPPIVELRKFVNRFYQKTIWIWNYHNVTVNLKHAVHSLSKEIDDLLSFIELDDRSGDFDNPFEQTDYVIRPEIGLIEISQPLPVEWEAFNKAPAFEQHPLYQKIQRKTEQFIKLQRNNYFLIEELENFFTSLTRSTVAPPIENYAMIIGDSHFSTFHGVFYNFMSNCSYLLASDFKTKSFSLVLNYKNIDGKFRKTLEILTENSSIEIHPKFVVLYNNKSIDLPLILESTKVMREEENVIVESSKGFQILCNMHYDFCTVHLSGWLFGRTGGLLGTLDNENANLLLPNNTKTHSVADFTASWKLSSNCSPVSINNKTTTSTHQFFVKGLKKSLCSLFFSDANSPFHDCFYIINPKPFMEICMENMMDETDVTSCNAIAAYRHRCKRSKIVLDMPDMCLKCKGDIGVADEVLDGGNRMSADIVFITQLNCANNVSKTLLVDSLMESFNKIGYHDNRFASVGFGRNIYTYTLNDKIWSSNAINTNYVRESFISRKYRAVDAIKYASDLNFRAGVGKHLILLKCGTDLEFENLPEIYNMLGEKDITLHVLKPGPIAKPNHGSQVVGINVNNSAVNKLGAIITSNIHNEIIDGMTDVYSGLALITNGSIFELDSILENKNMSMAWADLVSLSLRKSPCQICKCVADSDGVGNIKCNRCLTPAAKYFLHEYDGRNIINFHNN